MKANSIPSITCQILAVVGTALTLSACNDANSKQTTSAEAPAAPPPTRIHEIKMHGDAKGYYFEPKMLVVKRGEAVRWVLSEGGPHNVNFTGKPVPTGAQVLLENGGKLQGTLLQAPGQNYDLQFTASYPAGEYNYVCDPHSPLGMSGKILLQP